MKLTIREDIASLKRAYPLINRGMGRFLHARQTDITKRSKRAVLLLMLWSDDGRASLHRTKFERTRAMSATEWSNWMQANSRSICIEKVIPYLNRTTGVTWNIDRAFGWYMPARGSQ